MAANEAQKDQQTGAYPVWFYCSNCCEADLPSEVDRYCVCGVEFHSYQNNDGEWVEIPSLFGSRGKWKSDLVLYHYEIDG
jgi:hypothetical protein